MNRLQLMTDFFRSLSRAYQMTFGSLEIENHKRYVLEDLAKFCHANATTANDPVAEGRRQVWLRIQEMLHLTPEQLMQLNEQRLAKRTTNG